MGVTCYKPTDAPVIDSFRTAGPPSRGVSLARNLSSGIQTLSLNYVSNRLLCKYRRMLNGSGNFMADLTNNQFAIWAYGDDNNGPGGHNAAERGFSTGAINFRFKVILITVIINFRICLKICRKVLIYWLLKIDLILITVS